MYWLDIKKSPGWDSQFILDYLKYELAMDILYPDNHNLRLHFWRNACSRIKLGLSDENLNTISKLMMYKNKHRLENLFSGMNARKRFELSMALINKKSIGPFLMTASKKEEFMHFFQHPDIYKIINWDVVAEYDSDKCEYNLDKVKYSVKYEHFIPSTPNAKPLGKMDKMLKLMEALGPKWKTATYIDAYNNEFYMEDNGVIRVRKYKQPLK